jgi:hypothetical protein
MQPTGRQQLLGQSGEAPHAHITTAPVRGLREAGHAKLRFHQCLPSVNRPLTELISGGRLLEPRWRLMVKSWLKLVAPIQNRQSGHDRLGVRISKSRAGFTATVFMPWSRDHTGIFKAADASGT